MNDFEKFCGITKYIINWTFSDLIGSFTKTFTNKLQQLFITYNKEDTNFVREEMVSLTVAALLFKGNPEVQVLFPRVILSPRNVPEFIRCALNSGNEDIFRMTVDLVKNSSLESLTNCGIEIILSKNFRYFKYFIENTLFRDEITYPSIFYGFAASSSVEIFKYIIETKPYTQNDIQKSFSTKININPEIIKIILDLKETNTFDLEIELGNNIFELEQEILPGLDEDSKNVKGESLLLLCLRNIANNEENLRVVKEHNDQYRAFDDWRLNLELRSKLLEIDQQIVILRQTLINLETLLGMDNIFASSTGVVLIQKTDSELELLMGERERIYQEFLQTNS